MLPPSPLVRRVVLSLLAIGLLAILGAGGYLLYLNHLMSRELLSYRWRTPTEIYSAKSGELVTRVYGNDWRVTTPVELSELPEHVPNAFIAAEDIRFRRHPGIDPIGMARAALANLRSRSITQGGSTINQQLIKSKFFNQERTFRRKIFEALLAIVLDVRMTKDEILEAYLNDVYLGHHAGRPVLGVDEGARLFFNKTPHKLTADEAALIAAVIRAPNRDRPDKRPDVARQRRDFVLGEMLERGWITQKQHDDGVRRRVRFVAGVLPQTPYPYYLGALRSEVVRTLGDRAVSQTGLRIVCEIDPKMQEEAERAARRGASLLRKRYSWLAEISRDAPLQVAVLSVDPRNGGIRALVGGSDYRLTAYDRTLHMKRQPGSAFKTFAYLAAIESREVTPATLLLDEPLQIRLSRNDVWEPHNYDERYRGRVTLREAFEKSLNVPTVRMTNEVGLGRVVSAAKRFGFQGEFRAIPALPLGVTEVSIREMTGAYTTFPNLGERTTPYLLTEVRRKNGEVLFQRQVERHRVADPAATYVLHSLLRGVVRRGTASRIRRYGLQHVAGKTGTTNDYRDAWFVGYTSDVVTTVWVGFDHGAPLRLSSAEAALPIWASYMAEVPTKREEIGPPGGVAFAEIDPESGYLWAEGCPGPVEEVFLQGTEPERHCPRGFFGQIVRRVLFEKDSFDEPAAITFEKFRRWAAEVERNRRDMEDTLEKLRRLFDE